MIPTGTARQAGGGRKIGGGLALGKSMTRQNGRVLTDATSAQMACPAFPFRFFPKEWGGMENSESASKANRNGTR
jgi:hypothetical protein